MLALLLPVTVGISGKSLNPLGLGFLTNDQRVGAAASRQTMRISVKLFWIGF